MIRKKVKGERQKEENAANVAMRRLSSPYSFFLIPSSLVFGIFGTIKNPLSDKFGVTQYQDVTTGLPLLITNVVRLTTIAAGIWMFGNLLTAGFMYLTSSGETEKVNKAWGMIYQSLIGLLIIVAAFAITGVISLLLYGDATKILKPTIYGPGDF